MTPTGQKRPFHTAKFYRIQCTSNANWARSHCTSSDAHRVNPPRDVDWKRIELNRVGDTGSHE